MTRQQALEALGRSEETTITPRQAAYILGCDPDTLRKQIAVQPAALGFPISKVGARTRIPREPFIRFMRGTV